MIQHDVLPEHLHRTAPECRKKTAFNGLLRPSEEFRLRLASIILESEDGLTLVHLHQNKAIFLTSMLTGFPKRRGPGTRQDQAGPALVESCGPAVRITSSKNATI